MALGAVLVGTSAVMAKHARRRAGARRHLLHLANEIDKIASTIEGDLRPDCGSAAVDFLRRSVSHRATRARLAFLSAVSLQRRVEKLHDDHGVMVDIRLAADRQVAMHGRAQAHGAEGTEQVAESDIRAAPH
jgi:hypothetical protein